MYRIRLHGRGGQGIQTAARVLGSAFFAQGFEVQDAPRFGAERRGAPIFATVRASRAPVRERGLVARADLVAVADPTLLGVRAAGVLDGIGEHSWLLVASELDAATWARRLARPGRVAVLAVDADADGERPFAGVACAAGAARMVGVLPREALARGLEQELAALGPAALAQSQARAFAAWEALAPLAGAVAEGPDAEPAGARPAWIDLPLDAAEIAAPDVRAPLSAVEVRTGLWRTQRPLIEDELCRRCSWVCSTFCPDGAIEVQPDRRPRIDYDHCKGCLVCVAVCPPHAIRVERETESAVGSGEPSR